MSYNISQWKTKRVEGLSIPLAALEIPTVMQQNGLEAVRVELTNPVTMAARIDVRIEEGEITGILTGVC